MRLLSYWSGLAKQSGWQGRSAPPRPPTVPAHSPALLLWEAIGAVSEQRWLTGLGWWGLPRALARAWNGDFDGAAWVDSAESGGKEGSWPGRAPDPAELGIREPPVAT